MFATYNSFLILIKTSLLKYHSIGKKLYILQLSDIFVLYNIPHLNALLSTILKFVVVFNELYFCKWYNGTSHAQNKLGALHLDL